MVRQLKGGSLLEITLDIAMPKAVMKAKSGLQSAKTMWPGVNIELVGTNLS